ncbi:hypothetical protein [Nocardioides sp. LML1-1-1.1]|uniref:hypothetical protein n=1 Tax=Nocardioides sp. LML1-1-1.1 TaxID=3135248 RepID=UPI0034314631
MLESTIDTAAADWLVSSASTTSGPGLRRLVPARFEAILRVFHPFGNGAEPVSWETQASERDIDLQWNTPSASLRDGILVPPGRQLDVEQVKVLAETLPVGRADGPAAGSIYIGAWVGWGDYRVFDGLPTYRGPRECFLFRGTMEDLVAEAMADARGVSEGRPPLRPYQWWPEDRSWYGLSDIDLDSTLLAGNRALLESVADRVESRFLPDDPDPDLAPLSG